MSLHRQSEAAWQTPTGYAASHCRNCDLGWTRTGKGGGAVTICLLNREPVLADMTSCDRYEQKAVATLTMPHSPEQAPDRAA
jgi:hypothetical protein